MKPVCFRITLLLFLTMVVIGCAGSFYITPKIMFTNHSSQEMMVLANFNYPDTSLEKAQYRVWRMAPEGKQRYGNDQYYWKKNLRKSGKVTIFFMPRSLREEYGKEEAKKQFKPKEKLILSLEDLEKAEWQIFYPYELNKTFKTVPHP